MPVVGFVRRSGVGYVVRFRHGVLRAGRRRRHFQTQISLHEIPGRSCDHDSLLVDRNVKSRGPVFYARCGTERMNVINTNSVVSLTAKSVNENMEQRGTKREGKKSMFNVFTEHSPDV